MLQPVFWALQLLILAAGLLVMAASLVLGAWVRRSLLTGPGLGSRPAASSWGLASEYSSQSRCCSGDIDDQARGALGSGSKPGGVAWQERGRSAP